MANILLLLLLLLTIVNSQPPKKEDMQHIPDEEEMTERCDRPAEFMYRQCCIFPPFFVRTIAKACGAKIEIQFLDKSNNVTALRRRAPTECDHWECVLKKYSLVNDDNATLNEDKYLRHLDRWAGLNPAFKEAIDKSKVHCMNQMRMYMPLTFCEFFNFHSCIRNFVVTHCPVIIPSPECNEVKLFYEECRNFFI